MADSSIFRTSKSKKASESFLLNSTLITEPNTGRLTFPSGSRLQKITSTSLERLTFISEKDSCPSIDLENYELEYSTYLLRRIQNKLLLRNQEERMENVKKCFVSLKFELEELLEKFVELSKEVAYFKGHLEIIKQTELKIEVGRNVLQIIRENELERLLESLSRSLSHSTDRLQLIDLRKSSLDQAFTSGVLGSGSNIEESLTKINSSIKRNKEQVSEIADMLLQLKKLCTDITVLRSRYISLFSSISTDIAETNYTKFTNPVLDAFKKRVQGGHDSEDLLDAQEILQTRFKFCDSLQISKLQSPYCEKPHSSSTPQPN